VRQAGQYDADRAVEGEGCWFADQQPEGVLGDGQSGAGHGGS
jgi:hypothetical protein